VISSGDQKFSITYGKQKPDLDIRYLTTTE